MGHDGANRQRGPSPLCQNGLWKLASRRIPRAGSVLTLQYPLSKINNNDIGKMPLTRSATEEANDDSLLAFNCVARRCRLRRNR